MMESMLEFIKEFKSLKITNLSKEKVFEYFFFSERRSLFLTDSENTLLGIISLGDFSSHLDDIKKAVNKSYLFIRKKPFEMMLSEAKEIYDTWGIQSEIPVIGTGNKIEGYIVDRRLFRDKEDIYKKEINEAKEQIRRFKKSNYLKKEIAAFCEILADTEIFIRQPEIFQDVFAVFGGEFHTTVLSDGDYIEMVKKILDNHLTDQEKTFLIIDMELGNRDYLYNKLGVSTIYNLKKFMDELVQLVENEDFSRMVRITKTSRYRLTDFVDDNGMENIHFSANRLLTKYVYDYMKSNHIPLSLLPSNLTATMQVSCLVNGVRGNPQDGIGFTYCDLEEQQYLLGKKIKEKNISVFYIKGAVNAKLTENEKRRIKHFGRLETLIENDDEEALGQLYQSRSGKQTLIEYAKEVCYTYPVRRRFENDIIVNVDYTSPYVNFENGIRRTCYQPEKYRNTIYFTGPCFALGAFLEDKDTIPSLLSKKLLEKGYFYRVVNLGVLASNDSQKLLELLSLEEGDIVINMIYNESPQKTGNMIDPSDAFDRISNRGEMFFDKSVHGNRMGNKIYADVIYDSIKGDLKKESEIPLKNNNIYNVFKPNFTDLHLYGVQEYLNRLYDEKRKIPKNAQVIGSIVMNCNPFTLGHQSLVEYALNNCDYLILFVVQENKSYFSFEDRFTIAVENCKRYENISVIPSGNMIVSNFSFPEYFKREAVRDKAGFENTMMVTPTLDFRLFAQYIAPVLGITKRFVAEEPLDAVTEQYNETMKKVLSSFGIEVEEIPRKTLSDGEIISASKVRKMYRDKNFQNMKGMLSDSTYRYLMKKTDLYLDKNYIIEKI